MNPQIKKIIRKISKKNKVKSDDTQNNNATFPKRKFSFFRYSITKLSPKIRNQPEHRNSVDLAEIQRKSNKASVFDGKGPINIVNNNKSCTEIVNNNELISDESESKVKEYLDNDDNGNIGGIRRQYNASDSCPCISRLSTRLLSSSSLPTDKLPEKKLRVQKVDKKVEKNLPVFNESSDLVISSNSADTFQFILRKLFNYPNNFYVCLSYIITIFLLISTLYVAYQVDRLEGNLIRLIERNHNNLEKSQKNSPDWNKNRLLLISQIERLSQLMKNVQKRLS